LLALEQGDTLGAILSSWRDGPVFGLQVTETGAPSSEGVK